MSIHVCYFEFLCIAFENRNAISQISINNGKEDETMINENFVLNEKQQSAYI